MKRIMFWRPSSPSWPHAWRGSDENCNPSACLTVWPFGSVIVFYSRKLRDDMDGPCGDCRAECLELGCCGWCGSRPCSCCNCELEEVQLQHPLPARLHRSDCLAVRRGVLVDR